MSGPDIYPLTTSSQDLDVIFTTLKCDLDKALLVAYKRAPDSADTLDLDDILLEILSWHADVSQDNKILLEHYAEKNAVRQQVYEKLCSLHRHATKIRNFYQIVETSREQDKISSGGMMKFVKYEIAALVALTDMLPARTAQDFTTGLLHRLHRMLDTVTATNASRSDSSEQGQPSGSSTNSLSARTARSSSSQSSDTSSIDEDSGDTPGELDPYARSRPTPTRPGERSSLIRDLLETTSSVAARSQQVSTGLPSSLSTLPFRGWSRTDGSRTAQPSALPPQYYRDAALRSRQRSTPTDITNESSLGSPRPLQSSHTQVSVAYPSRVPREELGSSSSPSSIAPRRRPGYRSPFEAPEATFPCRSEYASLETHTPAATVSRSTSSNPNARHNSRDAAAMWLEDETNARLQRIFFPDPARSASSTMTVARPMATHAVGRGGSPSTLASDPNQRQRQSSLLHQSVERQVEELDEGVYDGLNRFL